MSPKAWPSALGQLGLVLGEEVAGRSPGEQARFFKPCVNAKHTLSHQSQDPLQWVSDDCEPFIPSGTQNTVHYIVSGVKSLQTPARTLISCNYGSVLSQADFSANTQLNLVPR